MFSEFRNEALTDFSQEPHRRAFAAALERVRARLPIEGRLLIDGEWIATASTFESRNPSARDQVIGRFAKGTRGDALKAVDAAAEAFRTWKETPPDERAKIIVRIASILRDRKHEFSAMMSLEAGKSWDEADGDTAEAIDFCEFYAREMHRLAQPQPLTPVPGERARWNSAARRRRDHSPWFPSRF
jgi:1-pyrroline-5-carboxylate dehydrogenase